MLFPLFGLSERQVPADRAEADRLAQDVAVVDARLGFDPAPGDAAIVLESQPHPHLVELVPVLVHPPRQVADRRDHEPALEPPALRRQVLHQT